VVAAEEVDSFTVTLFEYEFEVQVP
jgi:hypothetical protein